MKEKSMENEMKNADLSDIMCDLLYLLGCGVNDKMPAIAYIAAFQKAYDADKLQTDTVSIQQGSFCGCTDRNRTEKGRSEASGRVGTEHCQSHPQGHPVRSGAGGALFLYG